MVLQIRIERVRRDISVWKFAQMLEIDPQRWRWFETGQRATPPEVAERAADVLGIPVENLFKPVSQVDTYESTGQRLNA